MGREWGRGSVRGVGGVGVWEFGGFGVVGGGGVGGVGLGGGGVCLRAQDLRASGGDVCRILGLNVGRGACLIQSA